jgi:hypothetical protein
MTVKDIVAFIIKNRKGKVCKDWSLNQIRTSVILSLNQRALSYTTNGSEITGIVMGDVYEVNKILHINAILTTDKDALRLLVKQFSLYFKGWKLTADRRVKLISYDTAKLISKLQ